MILLVAVALATVVSLLAGGKLRQLAEVQLVQPHLILISLFLQMLIFTPWWHAHGVLHQMTNGLYVTSLALLMIACWKNRHIPGIVLLGVGLVSNAVVILANGGRMPAFLGALRAAGLVSSSDDLGAFHATNSMLITIDTPLWFLGDILAVPKSFPLANVYSIGDILITEGAVAFVVLNMRGQPAPIKAPDNADPEEALSSAMDPWPVERHGSEHRGEREALEAQHLGDV